jgi:hypothetical protein
MSQSGKKMLLIANQIDNRPQLNNKRIRSAVRAADCVRGMLELRCWDWFARRGRGTSLRIPGAVADFRAVVAGTHRLSSRFTNDRMMRGKGNEATPSRWRALSSSEFGMWTRENLLDESDRTFPLRSHGLSAIVEVL